MERRLVSATLQAGVILYPLCVTVICYVALKRGDGEGQSEICRLTEYAASEKSPRENMTMSRMHSCQWYIKKCISSCTFDLSRPPTNLNCLSFLLHFMKWEQLRAGTVGDWCISMNQMAIRLVTSIQYCFYDELAYMRGNKLRGYGEISSTFRPIIWNFQGDLLFRSCGSRNNRKWLLLVLMLSS